MKQAKNVWKRVWALFCVLLTLPGVASASSAVPLGTIQDVSSAIAAATTQAQVMTESGAFREPIGAVAYVDYMENAMAHSSPEVVTDSHLILNAQTVNNVGARLETQEFRGMIDTAIANANETYGGEYINTGLSWGDSMSVTAEFQMPSSDITVEIAPDIVNVTSVDRILIRTPFYDLSFYPFDLQDDLSETLKIDLRDVSETLEPRIKVEISDKELVGYLTLSFSGASGKLVSVEEQKSIVSIYNPVTEQTNWKLRYNCVYFPDPDIGTPTEDGKHFNDLEGLSSERQKAIQQLWEGGIIEGYSTEKFGPYDTVTRGQFVKIIVNAICKGSKSSKTQYSDVKPGMYYYDHAGIAQAMGYMNGYSDGTFHGERTLSRANICAVIGRILKQKKHCTVNNLEKALSRYGDWKSIPGYAQEPVAILLNRGVLSNADRTFHSSQAVTRGELAEMVYHLLQQGC